jgi:hypothetical protein
VLSHDRRTRLCRRMSGAQLARQHVNLVVQGCLGLQGSIKLSLNSVISGPGSQLLAKQCLAQLSVGRDQPVDAPFIR